MAFINNFSIFNKLENEILEFQKRGLVKEKRTTFAFE